jgi:transcriptional regulator with XRE-family HTH domain
MIELRHARRTRRMTLSDAALCSGLSARRIAELELGLCPLSNTERLLLAEAFDLPADALTAPRPQPLPTSYLISFSRLSPMVAPALVATVLLGDALMSAPSRAQSPSMRNEPAYTVEVSLVKRSDPEPWQNKRQAMRPINDADLEAVFQAEVVSSQARIPAIQLIAAPPETVAAEPSVEIAISPSVTPTEQIAPNLDIVTATRMDAIPTETAAPEPSMAMAAPEEISTAFLPLPASGPFHQNVAAALNGNNGALQLIVVPPGETWSFNQAIGDPTLLNLAFVNGIYGGGWCNLASRYVVALRPLLPPEAIEFTRHVDITGFGLSGIANSDAVIIWNEPRSASDQDLKIHNTSDKTLIMTSVLTDAGVEVAATLQ